MRFYLNYNALKCVLVKQKIKKFIYCIKKSNKAIQNIDNK